MAQKQEKKSTKKHLRTLAKNSSAHHIRNTGRVVKYGTVNFARNIWLSAAATMVMTITLLVLAVTIVASLVLTQTAQMMRDKIDTTIYFSPDTTAISLNQMRLTMEKDSNVKEVTVKSSEEEFEMFLEENADNEILIATVTDPDMKKTMLSTMSATMRIKVVNIDDIESIKFTVENDPVFIANLDKSKEPTYDTNRAEIATITKWANIAKTGGLILGAVFLVISVLVIFNTIRMAIFSRREEIYMMKLVGADKSFIRGPFLVEAQMSGLVSGLLAATLGLAGFNFIAPRLDSYGIDISLVLNILHSGYVLVYYLAMVAIGMFIGSISARLAVHKYLNKA